VIVVLPAFSVEWIVYELGKWLTFRLTERAVKRLISSLRNVPRVDEDIFTLDRKIRDKASEEISVAVNSISSTMKLASRSEHEQMLESLGYLKASLKKFRENFIVFTNNLVDEEGIKPEGLLYLDYILLSGCFAINETARDLIDVIQEKEYDNLSSDMDEIKRYIRDLERIAHIRSTALSVSNGNFLRILEFQHPNVYETIRAFAAFAYRSSGKRKGLFRRKNYDEICGRVIYVAKVLEEEKGPVVEFSDFYSDFVKLNPDIEISVDDLEKATRILIDKGFMGGLETSEEGLNHVILRYDYAGLLNVIDNNVKMKDQGVTLEQLMIAKDLPKCYIARLLGQMEKDGTARKVTEFDGTVRWFFPGLKAQGQAERIC